MAVDTTATYPKNHRKQTGETYTPVSIPALQKPQPLLLAGGLGCQSRQEQPAHSLVCHPFCLSANCITKDGEGWQSLRVLHDGDGGVAIQKAIRTFPAPAAKLSLML